MPDIQNVKREQDAVLWAFLRSDGHGGPVVDDALALNADEGNGVRWKWTDGEVMQSQDGSVVVDAKVVVNLDVPVDSLMWLGRLDDLAGTAGPQDQLVSGLCQVKTVYWTPNLKSRVNRRTLGLVRFRGSLPEGVG